MDHKHMGESVTQVDESGPTLTYRSSVLNKLVWSAITTLLLVLYGAGLPAYIARLRSACLPEACVYFQLTHADATVLRTLGLSLDIYAYYLTALLVFTIAILFAIAAVLFWRSQSRMAVFVSFLLLFLGPTFFAVLTEALVVEQPGWNWPLRIIHAIGLGLILVFSYLFPNGRFVPKWTRVILPVAVAWAVAVNLFSSYSEILLLETTTSKILIMGLIALVFSGALAQVSRYRFVSGPIEKQQARWVASGFILFTTVGFCFVLVSIFVLEVRQPSVERVAYILMGGTLNVLSLLLFLVLLSVAILRYRLWDLDLIINRTLVYGALTTILVITYYSSVVFLQQLIAFFVELQDSSFLIVLSTLAISVLFNPLRRRLQLIVDRRFFRKKYDAVKTMENYSKSLRDEVNLDQMSERLVSLVEETMMPEHVSLWIVETVFNREANANPGLAPHRSSPID
jgi:hypothetical protein